MFSNCELDIIGRGLVVYRNDIYRSLILDRCIVTRSRTHNFILESRITIAKVISDRLIRKLTKICNSYFVTSRTHRRDCGTIIQKLTPIWETGYDNRSECSCRMNIFKFIFCKCMFFIFININNKGARNGRQVIVTNYENFISMIFFIIRSKISTF